MQGRSARNGSRIAVVGAGLAGLTCARTLVDLGFEVTIFDKGRAVGGRVATRRSGRHTFDLGAQYFTARDTRFRRQVRTWIEAGACAPWNARIVAVDGASDARNADRRPPPQPVEPLERLVGTPDMSALARHMAAGHDVRSGHRVDHVAKDGESLLLRGLAAQAGVTLGPAAAGDAGTEDLGRYDGLAVCMPPSQAAILLDGVSPALAATARAVALDPCFAVGVAPTEGNERALRTLAFDGAFIGRDGARSSPLAWVARDSSKPGRPPGERWVLHASAEWSRAWYDRRETEVIDAMVAELERLFGVAPVRPALTLLRRWSLARAPEPLREGALYDAEARVGIGGDWACGGRVEGAFLSGLALAERMSASASRNRSTLHVIGGRP